MNILNEHAFAKRIDMSNLLRPRVLGAGMQKNLFCKLIQHRDKNRIYIILLSLSAILFLILYFILSFRNQYSADDNALLALVQEAGVWDTVAGRYFNFCARWSSDTVAFSMIEWHRYKFFLPLFHILTLLTLICSFFLLLKKIFSISFQEKISGSVFFLYAIILACSFFFASYNIHEVWFWYVSAWTYLWSIIAGNFLFWILILGKIRWFHYPISIILTAYIAGAAESYALVYLFFLLVLFFIKQKEIFPVFFNRIQTRLLLVTLLLLFLFFLFTLFAPGTWARKEILTDASFYEHCIMVLKAFGKIVLFQTPQLLPYLLLFSLPWMMLGEETSYKSQVTSHKFQENKKIMDLFYGFAKSIFLLLFLLFLLILPASWVLYDLPPTRALSQVSLLLSAFSALIFFHVGNKSLLSQRISQYIILIFLFISVFVLFFHIICSINYCYTDAV